MRWSTVFIVLLAATAVAAGEPAQRARRAPRVAPAADEVVRAPGAVTREGKFWVEEIQGQVAPAPRVKVHSEQGNISIVGAPQPLIHYRIRKRVAAASEERARRIFAEYPLQVRRRGDIVFLAIEAENGNSIQAEYFVTVPRVTRVIHVDTAGGALAVREVGGTVNAVTGGGQIDVDQIGGDANLETAGGPITVGTVTGRVRAETAGGPIKLGSAGADSHLLTRGGDIEVGRAATSIRAETAGGGIRIGSAGADAVVTTAGGSIQVGQARRVTASSAGGSIQVDKAMALVRAETMSGTIRLSQCEGPVRAGTAAGSIFAFISAAQGNWGESRLETSMGDITVYVPRNLAMTVRAAIEAASARNRIVSDFPVRLNSGEGPGPREIQGEISINGGGAPLRLRAVSGNIEIRSQK